MRQKRNPACPTLMHQSAVSMSGRQWAKSPTETRKSVIKATHTPISGSCTLLANRAAFNQYQVSGQCPLCQGEPEDRIHFILLCPTLSKSRDI